MGSFAKRNLLRKNAIYLQELPHVHKAFIVADPGMVKFGFVDKVLEQLAIRPTQVETSIYGSVQPDPTLSEAIAIARQMKQFEPDTVICLGGGSALDAGKIGRLIYEYDARGEADLSDDASLKELFQELAQNLLIFVNVLSNSTTHTKHKWLLSLLLLVLVLK